MPNFDCKNFLGDKPCKENYGKMCPLLTKGKNSCPHYKPLGEKILVIKLGAMGDVLRTTSLLPPLKKKFPFGSVAWITKSNAINLLDNSNLWKILPWGIESILWAQNVQWDVLICLDKEEGPTSLATKLQAGRKYGFGRNSQGLLTPLSESSEYLFNLGLDDNEKFFENQISYPQLISEACELIWGPNPYVLKICDQEVNWAIGELKPWGKTPYIGLNIGSGEAFAGKAWKPDSFIKLSKELQGLEVTPVFLGGTREKEVYEAIKLSGEAVGIFPGYNFSLREFISLISQLSVTVAGDTLAMHISIALGVYTVGLFGSTSPREIEFYGKGESILGNVSCAPCYKKTCTNGEECLESIPIPNVLEAVKRGLQF
ncbi:glycosyltransferase family 9 protein [bacterium]|nr:glycosyltransferase family 9 protein [bacterium]